MHAWRHESGCPVGNDPFDDLSVGTDLDDPAIYAVHERVLETAATNATRITSGLNPTAATTTPSTKQRRD
jgi:hypothetical protein